jgi:hypothetical protein
MSASTKFFKQLLDVVNKQDDLCQIMLNVTKPKGGLSKEELTEIILGLESLQASSKDLKTIIQGLLDQIYKSEN